MKFKEFQFLNDNILKSLTEMGYDNTTPIQEKTINYAVNGLDIIGQAQTGTGKTGAFGIPIINSISENSKSFENLIIAPTRELANQIFNQLKKIGKYSNIKIALILGGVSYEKQMKFLNERPHIIVATPGRLNDYLINKKINLENLKTFTLDEADELLNIGFQKEIESIITFLPEKRQNFFFTATFNEKTKKLAQLITNKNAKNISISSGLNTTKTIKQEYIIVKEKNKWSYLIKILEFYKPKSVIIFGRTKKRVDELNDALNVVGFSSAAIQGDMQQRERSFVMDKFRQHQKNILVATDVVARGIDINHIEWIINFDLPQEIEYYTHRIGRAGRAGKIGYSLSFVKPDEIEHIKEIAHKTNSFIKEYFLPSEDELYKAWRNDLDNKLQKILDEERNNSNLPEYLEYELNKRFSKEELSFLLANSLLVNKNKKIVLSPEPSIILKGRAKINKIKNRINRFNKNIKNNDKTFFKKN